MFVSRTALLAALALVAFSPAVTAQATRAFTKKQLGLP